MIKKIFTLTIIYIFTFFNVNAFLGESNGLDLYKNIDKGMEDLKLKNYEYELTGGGTSISNKVNKALKDNNLPECIKPGLKPEDFNLISYGNVAILSSYIKTLPGCYDNEGIDINMLNRISSIISNMNVVYKQKANNKSDDIYKISRIGIYSDGDLNNSSFDLINDMEEIDKVIFGREIPYIGEKLLNTDKLLGNFLAGKKNNINPPLVTTKFLQNKNNINNQTISSSGNTSLGGNTINLNNSLSIEPLKTNNNNYVCAQDYQNSGFNQETLNFLISNSGTLFTGNTLTNSTNSGTTSSGGLINTGVGNENGNINKKNNINKFLNTSLNWPCKTFFCIKIDYQTYSNNILKGWNTLSIESYINTSNGHLKKFTGTSLVQSRMTVNQFQLGLKNLKLSDIFHIGIMISKKSPPILKDDRRKPGEYKEKLREYYKNNNKNYDKQNSLSIYLDKQNEKKNVLNSAETPIITLKEKEKYLKNKQLLESKKNKLVENELDHKILYEDMNIFYEKFIPLENFTANILNYSDNLSAIIKAMNDKPSN